MDASADTLKKKGKKALIVTDAMMVELGNCAKVERVLEHAKVGYSVFDRIGGRANRRDGKRWTGAVQAGGL